jgi:hypothetical protein
VLVGIDHRQVEDLLGVLGADVLLLLVGVEEELHVEDGGVATGELVLGRIEPGGLVRLPLDALLHRVFLGVEENVPGVVGVDVHQLGFFQRGHGRPQPPNRSRSLSIRRRMRW